MAVMSALSSNPEFLINIIKLQSEELSELLRSNKETLLDCLGNGRKKASNNKETDKVVKYDDIIVTVKNLPLKTKSDFAQDQNGNNASTAVSSAKAGVISSNKESDRERS